MQIVVSLAFGYDLVLDILFFAVGIQLSLTGLRTLINSPPKQGDGCLPKMRVVRG